MVWVSLRKNKIKIKKFTKINIFRVKPSTKAAPPACYK